MELIIVMKNLLNNIYLAFTNPKKLFSNISEKKNLKNVFFLICLIGLTTLIYYLAHAGDSIPEFARTEERSRTFSVLYPIFMGFLLIFLTYIWLLIESFLVKVTLQYFKIKRTVSLIMSVMVYTYLPLLVATFINIFWPHFSEKLTLGFLLSNDGDVNSRLFSSIGVIGVFEIWSLVLQVLAVSSVSGLSYRKSSLIVAILFLVTMIIPNLMF